jgi:hypothetical protein
MILDREQLDTVDRLYAHPVMYLAISGHPDRDTIETIDRYLPDLHLLRSFYDTEPVWIAVVPARNVQFCVDRLGSGLIGASAHEYLVHAEEAATEMLWRIRS